MASVCNILRPNAPTIWTPNSPYWVCLNQNHQKNAYKKVTHFQSWKNGFAKFIGESTSSCRYGMCLQCIGAECPRNMGSQLPILSVFEPKLSRQKKCLQKSNLFSELKNGFAKFIGESTSSCRCGMCLQCIGAECPRNMGSQLPILSAFELKQYPSAKRVHSAKVIWFRWFCQK